MKRHNELSLSAKALLDELTPIEAKTIKKNYPFRRDRENLIRELSKRGVMNKALSELSGLSDSTISRIRLDEKGCRYSYKRKE